MYILIVQVYATALLIIAWPTMTLAMMRYLSAQQMDIFYPETMRRW